MTKQDQAEFLAYFRYSLSDHRPPMGYSGFNFDPGGVLSRQVYGSAATAPQSCAVVMASYIRAGGGKIVRALERRYLSSQATLGCPAHDEER
jgi:hypothetical protein